MLTPAKLAAALDISVRQVDRPTTPPRNCTGSKAHSLAQLCGLFGRVK
jgi:hypothetical protein